MGPIASRVRSHGTNILVKGLSHGTTPLAKGLSHGTIPWPRNCPMGPITWARYCPMGRISSPTSCPNWGIPVVGIPIWSLRRGRIGLQTHSLTTGPRHRSWYVAVIYYRRNYCADILSDQYNGTRPTETTSRWGVLVLAVDGPPSPPKFIRLICDRPTTTRP
jgi:hypothetical protein